MSATKGHTPVCRWCGAPIEECLPHEAGKWVHEDTGMSLCWAAPDGESAAPTLRGEETPCSTPATTSAHQ